jgi:hypothetical protein
VRLRFTLPALAAAALLGACGGTGGGANGEGDGAAQEIVVEAADRTAEAGSYRSTFTLAFEGLKPETLHIEGEGLFQTDPTRGRMTMDLTEFGRAAEQELGEAEFIFADTVLYMRFPALSRALPEVEPWIRFEAEQFASDRELGLGQLSQLAQGDPSQTLDYLRGAGENVKEVGEEEVRGAETTHYRTRIDLDRVAEEAPEQRRAVQRLIEMSGLKEVPTDVWIDEDDRVRRLQLAWDDVRFVDRQETDMTLTTELFDFGVEVDVEPPPREEVTDIGDLLGRGAEETEHSEG